MLNRVTHTGEINEAVGYIGDNFKATPYLYVNLIKYGLGTDNVYTWIDRNEDNQIEGIYMLYYDCIHFYTNDIDTYPVERLISFEAEVDNKVLMLQGGIGDRVISAFNDYYSERNFVLDMDKCGVEDKEYKSEIANRNDIESIVELMISAPEYENVYDKKILTQQMLDRFDDDFSRYFVVRMDDKVVATCSTYGEVDNFALVGGTIVHPDYRKRGLGADVENYACHVLDTEGKSRVGFVNEENTASLILHEKIGAFAIATLAKFVRL